MFGSCYLLTRLSSTSIHRSRGEEELLTLFLSKFHSFKRLIKFKKSGRMFYSNSEPFYYSSSVLLLSSMSDSPGSSSSLSDSSCSSSSPSSSIRGLGIGYASHILTDENSSVEIKRFLSMAKSFLGLRAFDRLMSQFSPLATKSTPLSSSLSMFSPQQQTQKQQNKSLWHIKKVLNEVKSLKYANDITTQKQTKKLIKLNKSAEHTNSNLSLSRVSSAPSSTSLVSTAQSREVEWRVFCDTFTRLLPQLLPPLPKLIQTKLPFSRTSNSITQTLTPSVESEREKKSRTINNFLVIQGKGNSKERKKRNIFKLLYQIEQIISNSSSSTSISSLSLASTRQFFKDFLVHQRFLLHSLIVPTSQLEKQQKSHKKADSQSYFTAFESSSSFFSSRNAYLSRFNFLIDSLVSVTLIVKNEVKNNFAKHYSDLIRVNIAEYKWWKIQQTKETGKKEKKKTRIRTTKPLNEKMQQKQLKPITEINYQESKKEEKTCLEPSTKLVNNSKTSTYVTDHVNQHHITNSQQIKNLQSHSQQEKDLLHFPSQLSPSPPQYRLSKSSLTIPSSSAKIRSMELNSMDFSSQMSLLRERMKLMSSQARFSICNKEKIELEKMRIKYTSTQYSTINNKSSSQSFYHPLFASLLSSIPALPEIDFSSPLLYSNDFDLSPFLLSSSVISRLTAIDLVFLSLLQSISSPITYVHFRQILAAIEQHQKNTLDSYNTLSSLDNSKGNNFINYNNIGNSNNNNENNIKTISNQSNLLPSSLFLSPWENDSRLKLIWHSYISELFLLIDKNSASTWFNWFKTENRWKRLIGSKHQHQSQIKPINKVNAQSNNQTTYTTYINTSTEKNGSPGALHNSNNNVNLIHNEMYQTNDLSTDSDVPDDNVCYDDEEADLDEYNEYIGVINTKRDNIISSSSQNDTPFSNIELYDDYNDNDNNNGIDIIDANDNELLLNEYRDISQAEVKKLRMCKKLSFGLTVSYGWPLERAAFLQSLANIALPHQITQFTVAMLTLHQAKLNIVSKQNDNKLSKSDNAKSPNHTTNQKEFDYRQQKIESEASQLINEAMEKLNLETNFNKVNKSNKPGEERKLQFNNQEKTGFNLPNYSASSTASSSSSSSIFLSPRSIGLLQAKTGFMRNVRELFSSFPSLFLGIRIHIETLTFDEVKEARTRAKETTDQNLVAFWRNKTDKSQSKTNQTQQQQSTLKQEKALSPSSSVFRSPSSVVVHPLNPIHPLLLPSSDMFYSSNPLNSSFLNSICNYSSNCLFLSNLPPDISSRELNYLYRRIGSGDSIIGGIIYRERLPMTPLEIEMTAEIERSELKNEIAFNKGLAKLKKSQLIADKVEILSTNKGRKNTNNSNNKTNLIDSGNKESVESLSEEENSFSIHLPISYRSPSLTSSSSSSSSTSSSLLSSNLSIRREKRSVLTSHSSVKRSPVYALLFFESNSSLQSALSNSQLLFGLYYRGYNLFPISGSAIHKLTIHSATLRHHFSYTSVTQHITDMLSELNLKEKLIRLSSKHLFLDRSSIIIEMEDFISAFKLNNCIQFKGIQKNKVKVSWLISRKKKFSMDNNQDQFNNKYSLYHNNTINYQLNNPQTQSNDIQNKYSDFCHEVNTKKKNMESPNFTVINRQMDIMSDDQNHQQEVTVLSEAEEVSEVNTEEEEEGQEEEDKSLMNSRYLIR